MKFSKKIKQGLLDKYVFEQEKEDEVGNIIKAISFFFEKEKLYSIEIYSRVYGIVNWNSESNVLTGKSWESEETAQKVSYLNYHFTGKFINSEASEELIQKILEDVLYNKNNPIILAAISGLEGKKELFEQINKLIH